MSVRKHINILENSIAHFRFDRRGNTATMFALAILPLMATAGAGIDYGRLMRARTDLQTSADQAALDLSQQAKTSTAEALKARAQAILAATSRGRTVTLVADPTVDSSTNELCLQVATNVDTTLMRLVNASATTVGVRSCATAGAGGSGGSLASGGTVEIALALDNTGSMSHSDRNGAWKIASLRSAATSFIDLAYPGGQSVDGVKISLVPFSSAVNVGAGNRNAAWMDGAGQSSIHWENTPKVAGSFSPSSRFDFFSNLGVSWGGCVEERLGAFALSDQAATTANPDSLFVPLFAPDEADRGDYYFVNNYISDLGSSICTSGDASDTRDKQHPFFGDGQSKIYKYKAAAGKTLSVSTRRPGPNWSCNSQPVQPLTNNPASLKSQISAMEADGSTNLVAGVMWGWRTISPNGPFANAKSYADTTNRKILIFMTDGQNYWGARDSSPDKSDYSAFGFYWNNRLGQAPVGSGGALEYVDKQNVRALLDSKTLTACANAKAAGVTIYTIGFSVDSDRIDEQGETLLKNCATTPGNYYKATDGAAITAAFHDIITRISMPRLTR